MKRKRLVALFSCASLAATGCLAVGCGTSSGDKPVNDGKTVNIMMVNSGYGTAWIEDVAEEFEKTYESEGYKINILPARATFSGRTALSEMQQGWKETGYDICIPAGLSISQLLDPEIGACIADIDEVYNNAPIGYDGIPAEKTIKQIAIEENYNDYRYMADGHYYSFMYSDSIRGLVYNAKVLDKCGITEAPRTTDEMFEMFDTILKEGLQPITWGGGSAAGYSLPPLYLWIAQMFGVEKYDEFFKLDYLLNAEGKIDPKGYEFYEDERWADIFEALIHSWDVMYSVRGSKMQKHDVAHAQLVTGKTAFMFDGEFFFNEVKNDFASYLNDIRFTAIPVISALGTELKLDGSGTDQAKCDDILSVIVKLVDDGTEVAAIETAVEAQFSSIDLTAEQIGRVVEARTAMTEGAAQSFVMKDSPVKDISYLFLRMLASKDAAKTVSKYGMITGFNKLNDVENVSTYTFINDAFKYSSMMNYRQTSVLVPNSVRAKTNMFLVPPYNANIPITLNDAIGVTSSVKQRNYSNLAGDIWVKVKDTVRNSWSDLVGLGGYTLAEE